MNYIMYIIMQTVIFIICGICLFNVKNERVSNIITLGLILTVVVGSGTLMMSSDNVERYSWVPAHDSSLDVDYYNSIVETDQWEAFKGINMGIFAVSLIGFFGYLVYLIKSMKHGEPMTKDNIAPGKGNGGL